VSALGRRSGSQLVEVGLQKPTESSVGEHGSLDTKRHAGQSAAAVTALIGISSCFSDGIVIDLRGIVTPATCSISDASRAPHDGPRTVNYATASPSCHR
jgi:hypothetical protein